MQRRRVVLGGGLLWASAAYPAAEPETVPFAPRAAVPAGYAPAYEATIRAAENEGRLVVYSTTDIAAAQVLIDDFRALYPRIEVEYEDLTSTELHHRFVAETQLGSRSADVVWSSAMDQQTALVDLGYALTYESPEAAGLPDWAKWRNQAFGTTFEPVAIVVNKKLLPTADVPHTRAELVRLLEAQPERFRGKVVTYNVEKSGVGFLLASQDAEAAPAEFWTLARALGRSATRFELTTDAMLKRVASGAAVLAYNVLGSYAVARAAQDPAIGVVFPKDRTLVVSRLMFINRKAANPNAARLWVDYLLSKRGQSAVAQQARLYALRGDAAGELTAARLQAALGTSMKPVPVGVALTRYLTQPQAYRDFVLQWRRTAAAR